MANKINISDYDFIFQDARAYFDFILWLHANPNGGTFQYYDFKVIVTTKQA
jgi:hypothetical protein